MSIAEEIIGIKNFDECVAQATIQASSIISTSWCTTYVLEDKSKLQVTYAPAACEEDSRIKVVE